MMSQNHDTPPPKPVHFSFLTTFSRLNFNLVYVYICVCAYKISICRQYVLSIHRMINNVHVMLYHSRVPYLALAATFGAIEPISAR